MLTTLRFLRAPLATVAALLTLTAALTACAGISTGGGGGGGSSPTATAAPTNTTVATTCAQVSGFSGATPVNIKNTPIPHGYRRQRADYDSWRARPVHGEGVSTAARPTPMST